MSSPIFKNLAIVIPAFNESSVIASVVTKNLDYGIPIVVDDGSTDDTATKAFWAGAHIVQIGSNKGYDNALISGIHEAIKLGFSFAITLDGDGQHDPQLIHLFLKEFSMGADLVLGIRSCFQRPSEALFAYLANYLWGIQDPLCGMKGYRLSKLNNLESLSTYSSIGTELTIKAARSGWNIQQVYVPILNRARKSRFGVGLNANWRVLKALLFGLLLARSI